MTEYRYFTIDGEPPCGGATPTTGPNAAPIGNNGGYLGSGVTRIVPRPDVGGNPNWQPWHNVPGLPTTSTTTAAPTTPAANTPLAPGSRAPTTDKPLCLPSGIGYIFPKDHTTIHVIESGHLPWEKPLESFKWRAYKVPTAITVGEFINQVCEVSGEQKRQGKTMKDASWKRIVECRELGDGNWGRGSEYYVGEGKAADENMKKVVKLSLAKLGWDNTMGVSKPPIWVATQVVMK